MRFITVIMKIQVTIATNSRALTRFVNVRCVDHERAISRLF
jgi:hypothetical protein